MPRVFVHFAHLGTRSRDEHDSMPCEAPGMGRAAANRGRLRPMDAGKSLPLVDAAAADAAAADAVSVVFSLRGGFHMSSITAAVSGLLTSPSFHSHGHRRGAHATSSSTSSSSTTSGTSNSTSIGQLPVGAAASLLSGPIQSFEQAIGAQSTAATGPGATAVTQAPSAGTAVTSGATSTTPSAATAATPGQGQELQAFQHSLVQALKQDGLTSNGTGNVVSSLQNLIQQLGSNGKPTAATQTLSSTFQNMVNGVSGSAAAASTSAGSSSSGSSNSGLQSFLNNLLQKVQASGAQSLTSAGSNVNTHV
jgi:hypothetical protein